MAAKAIMDDKAKIIDESPHKTDDRVFSLISNLTIKSLMPMLCVIAMLALLDVWQEIFFIGSVLELSPIGLSTHQVYMTVRTVGFCAAAFLASSNFYAKHKHPIIKGLALGLCLAACFLFGSLNDNIPATALVALGSVFGGLCTSIALIVSLEALQGISALGLFICWIAKSLVSAPLMIACYGMPSWAVTLTGFATPLIWAYLGTVWLSQTGIALFQTAPSQYMAQSFTGEQLPTGPNRLKTTIMLPVIFLLIAVFGFTFAFKEPTMGNGVFEPGSYTALGSLLVDLVFVGVLCCQNWRTHLTRIFQVVFPLTAIVYLFLPSNFGALQTISNLCSAMADSFVMLLALLLIAQAAKQRQQSLGRLLGFTWCAKTLGVWLGESTWLLLTNQGINVAAGDLIVSVIALVAVGVCIMVCTTSNLFDTLLELPNLPTNNLQTSYGCTDKQNNEDANAAKTHIQDNDPLSYTPSWLTQLLHEKSLTSREEEICLYLLGDDPYQSIEQKLFISKDTLKTHRQNIFRKFDVHSREELKVVIASHDPANEQE